MSYDKNGLAVVPRGLAATNLQQVIEQRCRLQPDSVALNFLHDGELDSQDPMSYGSLDAHARAILGALRGVSQKGDRALLLFPAGNTFASAFVACLYGGIVAVPAALPGNRVQDRARVFAIMDDCQPTAVLSLGEHAARLEDEIKERRPNWRGQVIDVGRLPVTPRTEEASVALEDGDLAFLQYTSGSTGSPKGVMLTHANIFHNERLIQTAFENSSESRLLTWLPMFHDMGLIGYTLHVLYLGARLDYMAPEAFLQRPMRWLQAVSRLRATSSGGPNFALELCVARYRAEECKDLDLSGWRRASTGAEPVRPGMLKRFHQTFAPHGLAETALCPVYGLAEAVLAVSARANVPPRLRRVKPDAYARGFIVPAAEDEDAKVLVGVGAIIGGQQALIINPRTLERAEANQIGEIWLHGPSVAKGYWRKEDATREVFEARPAGVDSDREYLRTGDLGYIDEDGELYITGRLKDTIIIGGKNYFPQDLEYVVETADRALRPGGGAVFSIEDEGTEKIVVVQEVRDGETTDIDLQQTIKTIRARIATEFQLSVFDVCLLKPKSLHKTTSGKVQRQRNKQAYLADELSTVARHRGASSSRQSAPPSGDALLKMVLAWIQGQAGAPADIRRDNLFVDAGMDSAKALQLAEHLSKELGRHVDVTLIWSYPEISRFCAVLADLLARGDAPAPDAVAPAEAKPNIHQMDEKALRAAIEKELA